MGFDLQPVLHGPLLEMRPLEASDFPDLYRVASDPLVWEQHPSRNRWEEAVFHDWYDEALASGGALVAIERKTGRIIGSSRYHGYDEGRREIEIGWSFLAREFWGGRYNAEMKALMLEHAYRFVDTVVFLIHPQNVRSYRSVEKIGAERAGVREKNGMEMLVYAVRGVEAGR